MLERLGYSNTDSRYRKEKEGAVGSAYTSGQVSRLQKWHDEGGVTKYAKLQVASIL